MDSLSKQVSYLRGLAKGLNVDESTNEGKLLLSIIDVLDEFSHTIDKINSSQVELNEYIKDIDDDLADLEKDYYDDEDNNFYLDSKQTNYYEIECPSCHQKVFIDSGMINNNEVICPNCKEPLEVEFDPPDDDNKDK